jgi:hypothetical protein
LSNSDETASISPSKLFTADSDHLGTDMSPEGVEGMIGYNHNSFQVAQPDHGEGLGVTTSRDYKALRIAH